MHPNLTGFITLLATGGIIALILPVGLWVLSGGLAPLFSAKMLLPLAIGIVVWWGNREVG
jgi:hypothetical protein